MKKTAAAVLLALSALAPGLRAVTPQKWEARSMEDFLKGKLEGLSLSYDGILSLAAREDKIAGPAEDFYLSLLALPDGTIFLGTGHGGKVYKIGKDGKAELYFQAPEMDITCLAMDKKGLLYAGTSPNGRIYKIEEKGKADQFFKPGEKYIWDIEFLESGSLLAAVGESGGIYQISEKGEGQLILKAEENHILCLKVTESGDIIAGSGGGGSVYRLAPGGKNSLIFESPYEEIKSIILDKEGQIYAAASGTPVKARREEPSAAAAVPVKLDTGVSLTVSTSGGVLSESAGHLGAAAASREPGALFKIGADGLARRIWNSQDEMVYSLSWNEAQDRILIATGSKGRIYALGKDEKASLLLQENSEQVYALSPAGAKTYVLANNPSTLSIVFSEQRAEGEYLSAVVDAKTVSSWGKLEWEADLPAGTMLQILSRSGNTLEPNKNWNEWSPPYQKKEEQILSPKARYLQLRILFRSQAGNASPFFRKVSLFYLQSNIAPVVNRLDALAPNEVFLKLPEQDDLIWGLAGTSQKEPKKEESRAMILARKAQRKGYQTFTWDAEDENGDQLSYTISARKEDENQWRVLEEDWRETIYAFDTVTLPDGIYLIKVDASDAPSNPAGAELKKEKISRALVIDNSLPVIGNLAVARNGNALDVAFQAEDGFSSIEKVEFLVRPGDWKTVFPADGICDSKQESFKFRIMLSARSDNLLIIRVQDRHGNVGVARQVF